MPEVTKFDPGVPSWVDLTTRDLEAALRFYRGLFHWEAADQGEESGHYVIATRGGRNVAGLSTLQADPGPPRWTTYIDVDDADEVARRVEAAGGRVLAGPMDVMGEGRMAVFTDPTGAGFAVWQPQRHTGAQVVNEPGALIWNELSTSDLDGARAFYSAVFGWAWAGSDDYAEFQVDGRTVGAVMPRPADLPAEVPDNWLVYFGTADLDADLSTAAALGATTLLGPTEIPGTGRFAVLSDPQGAVFALFEAQPPQVP